MALSCQGPVEDKPERIQVVDLEKTVKEWALNHFKKYTNVKRKNMDIQINWNDVDSRSEMVFCADVKSDNGTENEISNESHSTGHDNWLNQHVLFSMEYVNDTNAKQEYTFHTDRTTRRVFEIEKSKGFSCRKEVGIKLQAPEQLLEVTGNYSQELTLNKASRHSFEEELTWGTDYTIGVDPDCTATVMVTVKEGRKTCKFKVRTNFYGKIRASMIDKKNPKSFMQFTEQDIEKILAEDLLLRRCGLLEQDKTTKTVYLVSEGQYTFRVNAQQKVEVKQKANATNNPSSQKNCEPV
nr:unnamed protein product [Spirometra erinaceieuropaei]